MPHKRARKDYRDAEFFMSHHQKDAATDKGFVNFYPTFLVRCLTIVTYPGIRSATEPPLPSKPRTPHSTSPTTTALPPGSAATLNSPGTRRRKNSSKVVGKARTMSRLLRQRVGLDCRLRTGVGGSMSGRRRIKSACRGLGRKSLRWRGALEVVVVVVEPEGDGSSTTRQQTPNRWIPRNWVTSAKCEC